MTRALFAQTGEVGIGTLSPQAMLHVDSGTVLFNGGFTIPVVPGNPPVSGSGVRMMWYPDKAAFRAGAVSISGSTFWNKDSIGSYSFAAGYNAKAKGNYSVALGESTRATGNSAFSVGKLSRAYGDYSTAFSWGVANGDYSTAIGTTMANAIYGISTGSFTTANGYSGLVVGMHNDPIVTPQTTYQATTPLFIIGNGDNTIGQSNAMVVRKDGNVGIGTSYPQRRLHISNGPGGGLYHSNASVIFEADQNHYLQLSAPTGSESGILFGNAVGSIRSGVVFGENGDLDLRSGGNATRIRIEGSDGDLNMFSNELHRTATGDANMIPICYGSVSSTGVISSGTGNFTVDNPSTGRYDILITGEAYTFADFTATVSPISTAARMCATSASGGELLVRLYDGTGTLTNTSFHFVVYKP